MQEPCHWKKANVVFLLCITAVTASSGQTFNTLATFNLSNGASPQHMTLVQGHDGNFYGTTYYGGKNPNGGTVFRITPGGTLSTIHSFCWEGDDCGDGSGPLGGLLLATDGNFYGATEQGGNAICPYGCGTVFRVIPDIFSVAITPGGKLTTPHSFDYTDGAYPVGTLIQANNGNFYGTTYSWGTKAFGTVFQITPTGILTTLHNFAGLPDDGANPDVALVQSADGNFYGTTPFGGSGTSCDAGCGTIFKIAQDGKLTILHNFNYAGHLNFFHKLSLVVEFEPFPLLGDPQRHIDFSTDSRQMNSLPFSLKQTCQAPDAASPGSASCGGLVSSPAS